MKRRGGEPREADLNLVPFIDMFVTLILFMLVTVVLVRLGGILVETPAVSEASTQNKEKSQAMQLVIDVDQASILISPYTLNLEQKMTDLEKKFDRKDLAGMKAYLVELKAKASKFDPSLFHGAPELSYEQVSDVLDTVEAAQLGVPTVLAIGVFK